MTLASSRQPTEIWKSWYWTAIFEKIFSIGLAFSQLKYRHCEKRPDDVVQLAQHFLEQTCTDFGRKSLHLTKAQANALEAYDWPGNVRELKNVIERAVILTKGETLRLDLSMPATLQSSTNAGVQAPSKHGDLMTEDQMRDLQKQNLRKALEQSNWRVSGKEGAAALLGIRPTTLSDRIKSFGLKKPRR